MEEEEVAKYLTLLKTPWKVEDPSTGSGQGAKIEKHFKFKDFKESMAFVNKVADIAEGEGHHPDICVYYNKVDISLTTHAINGLCPNDFIIASKIELLIP
jgi:4a-hydroxytetrahydrobiopterin dehydratase